MPSHPQPHSRPQPRPHRWQRLRLHGLCAAALLLAGCGKVPAPAAAAAAAPASAAASAPAPATPAPPRVVRVGTDAVYPPFESREADGRIVGFTVDVVEGAAARGGFQARWVHLPWERLFDALARGEVDLIASSLTPTEERRQRMDFSQPYFEAFQLVAVPQDSRLSRFEQLGPQARVGVQTGTGGDAAVTQRLGAAGKALRRYDSTPLALQALAAGEVDAVVADNGVVWHHLARQPAAAIRTFGDPAFAPEPFGLAVNKGDRALLAQVEAGLAALRADGGLAAIHTRHFGSAPAAAAAAPAIVGAAAAGTVGAAAPATAGAASSAAAPR